MRQTDGLMTKRCKADFSTREATNYHSRRWVKRNLEKSYRRNSRVAIEEQLGDDDTETVRYYVEEIFQGTLEYFDDYDRPLSNQEISDAFEVLYDEDFESYDSFEFDTANGWY